MWVVTGGSGFVGSCLCRRLDGQRKPFRIVDKRPSQLFPDRSVCADICSLTEVQEHLRGDVIVHLAAEHRDDVRPRSRYDEVNINGTANICEAARVHGVNHIIFASSVAVYGFTDPDQDENGSVKPFNDYGRTKYEAENVLRRWQAELPQQRSLTIVRPTVVFGPGNRGNVFNLLHHINRKRFVMFGSGENRKSMAFVENLAEFIIYSDSFGVGCRVYNYVDKPDYSMNELVSEVRQVLFGKADGPPRLPIWLGLGIGHCADVVARVMGTKLPISSIRVRKFAATTTFASAAHRLEGFVPPFSLRDALRLTLEREFINPDVDAPIYYTE